eukprot:scaffold536339_cov42-Prasinocladus_malaysianus.AAC.1
MIRTAPRGGGWQDGGGSFEREVPEDFAEDRILLAVGLPLDCPDIAHPVSETGLNPILHVEIGLTCSGEVAPCC